MNLYSGGPSKKAITTNSNKNSSHPIAITGRQASIPNKSASKPIKKFLFITHLTQKVPQVCAKRRNNVLEENLRDGALQ